VANGVRRGKGKLAVTLVEGGDWAMVTMVDCSGWQQWWIVVDDRSKHDNDTAAVGARRKKIIIILYWGSVKKNNNNNTPTGVGDWEGGRVLRTVLILVGRIIIIILLLVQLTGRVVGYYVRY
jgi:hypothetical protein